MVSLGGRLGDVVAVGVAGLSMWPGVDSTGAAAPSMWVGGRCSIPASGRRVALVGCGRWVVGVASWLGCGCDVVAVAGVPGMDPPARL